MNRFFARFRNFGRSILRKLRPGRYELENPRRFPKNAAGPFYTTGECTACGLPEVEAPKLLAPLEDSNYHTYFVRQPETPEETEQAINALGVCCVDALRYGGRDREIISKLGNTPAWCDYVIMPSGKLERTIDENGELLPFARSICGQLWAEQERRSRAEKSKEKKRGRNAKP